MKLLLQTALFFSCWATFVSAQEPLFIVRDRVGTIKEGSIKRMPATNSLEMLSAEGKSTVLNIEQIDRGYENIEQRLLNLGAQIKRIK